LSDSTADPASAADATIGSIDNGLLSVSLAALIPSSIAPRFAALIAGGELFVQPRLV